MTAAAHEKPVWTRKHLLALAELTREEILHVLDTAAGFQEVSTRSVKKVPALPAGAHTRDSRMAPQ